MRTLEELIRVRGDNATIGEELNIIGKDPVLNTPFKLGEIAASAHACVGIAVNDLWEIRTGQRQKITVNVKSAAATLNSNKHLRVKNINGNFEQLIDKEHEANRQLNGVYLTKDGRWVLPHFGLNHLRDRMLRVLNSSPEPSSIAKSVSKWDAFELEAAIDHNKLCGGVVRTNTEWLSEKHGQTLAEKPVVEIIKIGKSEPEPVPSNGRPLTGLKVLDLTRILAGPITARTLAEHGAEVLMISANDTPQVHAYVADTSHGKRSCFLNIREKQDSDQLIKLARTADVFSQGYRPGAMEKHGFGVQELSAIRPGIIYVSINCYGFDGLFSNRAGWEQVAQIMTGLTTENSFCEPTHPPKLLPVAANDYITGYLGAYGVLLALARRAKEGGSYHVRVSLCQTAMMIYRNGKIAGNSKGSELAFDEVDALTMETATHLGRLKHLAPILNLSETPPFWSQPTPKLGSDLPEWSH